MPQKLGIAMVLLDANATVLQINVSARVILARADSLWLDDGRLRALRASDQRRLDSLLCDVAITGLPRAMSLDRRSGARRYLLHFRPVAEGFSLCIIDQSVAIETPPDLLQQMFQLTPAQIRLAQQLAAGNTLAQAAAALGIKQSTARTHQLAIFRKTECHGIQSLARLLASLGWLAQLPSLAMCPLDGEFADHQADEERDRVQLASSLGRSHAAGGDISQYLVSQRERADQ